MTDVAIYTRWMPAQPQLSPREQQTLQLLLNGQAEKQIANALQISKATVHVYVKGVYKSYGVSGRSELFALFLKHTWDRLEALEASEA